MALKNKKRSINKSEIRTMIVRNSFHATKYINSKYYRKPKFKNEKTIPFNFNTFL